MRISDWSSDVCSSDLISGGLSKAPDLRGPQMALTDTAIRKAKPKDKPYKVSDSGGLYLLVNPTGSKLWRVKYRLHGVERKLALGAYPAITLAEADRKSTRLNSSH